MSDFPIPAGYALVPLKSTDAMRYAWMNVYDEKGWNAMQAMWDAVLAVAAVPAPPIAAVVGEPVARVYGSQYTKAQREWCQRYERETTFEPLMCDFEASNESFLAAAINSRNWFESWSNDAFLRGCDDIPGEMEALHEEITGEKP